MSSKAVFGSHLKSQKWQDPKYKRHVHEQLNGRGIAVERAVEREYEPLTADETYKAIKQDVGPTIAITCLKADGTPQKERRYKLLDPKVDESGKPQKYTQRKGVGTIIHVRRPKKGAKVAYLTEGEFKTDEIHDVHGGNVVAISVPGVDSFRLSGALHPDVVAALAGVATLKFCYDTDQQEKPRVVAALFEAAELVKAHFPNIEIKFVQLPAVPNLEKTGADDLIRHDRQAFLHAPEHDYDSPWAEGQRRRIAKAAGAAPALPAFDLSPVAPEWFERRLPEPEYLVEGYLPRGIVAVLVAMGGAGKTNITLQLAAAAAGGEPFFWCKTEACRVAYVGLEDPPEELRRRVHRIHADRLAEIRRGSEVGRERRYEENVKKNLTVVSLVGQQLHLVTLERGGVVAQAPALDELIGRLKAERIELLVLDPMSRLHGVDENSNTIGTALVNAAERIAREVGCTVLINHHTGKENARTHNETAYAARGASGIPDAARCVLVLRAIDQKEAAGIKNVDQLAAARGDIVRLVHAKANYSRKMDPLWLRRGESGGFAAFMPDLKDATDDYGEFKRALRSWALGHPGTFSQREVTEENREAIFGKRMGRAAARTFFKQAVEEDFLQVSGKQQGGGEAHTLAAEGSDGA